MMAKKQDKKKADKKAKPAKPLKPAPAAGKKANKPAVKAAGKGAAKPASKPASKNKPAKPSKVSKPAHAEKKTDKKVSKPAPANKKAEEAKKNSKHAVAPAAKKAGKPIDAISKPGKGKDAPKGKGGKKPAAGDDDEAEAEVKDDYEKPEEEETPIDGALDEAGMIDLEGPPAPEIDEDDDEVPEKRGRGRRKKNEGKSTGGTMEAYIRNRPLQIDINKPLIKKGGAPAPKPFVNTEDKRTRYSDKELGEFKELILEKLREAQADYDLLKQTLSNEDNHGTDDTSPSFKLLEDGSDVMSKEETAQLASRQEKYIVNLKNALVRIENKAYGICRVTGKLIPKERLRSVPHATLGIDAKLGQS
jgi:DnaK suppressor protein